MALDPIAEQMLAQMAAMGSPPLHTLTPEQIRAARMPLPPGPDVHHVEDLEAPGPDGPIPVRIYWPREAQDLPALLWFHGGGWVIGSVEGEDATARRLATLADCVVVSVEYRLAPEHPYPAAVTDAYAAIVWTVQNAPRLGVDPARVAIAGYSAGGNLAAVAAQLLRDRGGPTPVHQVLVNPVTDCAMDTPSYAENDRYILTPEVMRWFFDHYCPEGGIRTRPDISPLRASDLSGLPPATVVTAEYDPLRDEGMAYAEAMRAAGVPVEARCFPGQMHTFFVNAHLFPQGQQAVEMVAERLRTAFARAAATSSNP
ncbi:MAG: alpha/beta hydrolase [Dehalococcoidia bacterium]|nr:alpha/beta hydrolase [Dehalococcoidia bacterium]